MGLGSHFHPKETRTPFHQFQRLPTTTAKGIRNLVVRADAALYAASQAASQAVSRTRAAASQATIKGNYAQVDDVRVPANKLMHIKVAPSRTPVVPVREHVREPVMSRMRMRIAAEAAVNAKANVGGSNKKPLKKLVKKPLVKPARKKVATRRISK